MTYRLRCTAPDRTSRPQERPWPAPRGPTAPRRAVAIEPRWPAPRASTRRVRPLRTARPPHRARHAQRRRERRRRTRHPVGSGSGRRSASRSTRSTSAGTPGPAVAASRTRRSGSRRRSPSGRRSLVFATGADKNFMTAAPVHVLRPVAGHRRRLPRRLPRPAGELAARRHRRAPFGRLLHGDHPERHARRPDGRRPATSSCAAFLLSPVMGALFAAGAAWYRRFLQLSNPNRGKQPAAQEGRERRPVALVGGREDPLAERGTPGRSAEPAHPGIAASGGRRPGDPARRPRRPPRGVAGPRAPRRSRPSPRAAAPRRRAAGRAAAPRTAAAPRCPARA